MRSWMLRTAASFPQQRQHCLVDLAPSQDSAGWIQTDIFRLRSGCSGQHVDLAILREKRKCGKNRTFARLEHRQVARCCFSRLSAFRPSAPVE